MDFKPGMVIVTQGKPKSIFSKMVFWATNSWWTHGFVTVSETEAVEAVIPRVRRMNIQKRISQLEQENRDYIVLDYPNITDDERLKVATAAESFVGRMYDVWNSVYFFIFKFWVEGGKRLVCSRLMAASFYEGLGVKIFSHAKEKLPESLHHRIDNLEDGYCSPDEVFRYSDLVVVERTKLDADSGSVF